MVLPGGFLVRPPLRRDSLGAHARLLVTAIRLVLIVLPVLAGWIVGAIFDLRAIRHLRSTRLSDRVAAFVLGPLAGVRYTAEGYGYRGLSIGARVAGLALTMVLAALLAPHP